MKKVLFFDDEPFITKYLIKSLREIYGWKGDKEITFVSTVDELLDEIIHNTEAYDLFVLDIMAPIPSVGLKGSLSKEEKNKMDDGMNTGLVLAEIIRKKNKTVPVLFLSAKQKPANMVLNNITDYKRKPVSPEEISNKMNELLNAH